MLLKPNKGRKKNNVLLHSLKNKTKHQNKEKQCKKYCICFYFANPGLLHTVRKSKYICVIRGCE